MHTDRGIIMGSAVFDGLSHTGVVAEGYMADCCLLCCQASFIRTGRMNNIGLAWS
ncbi:hypothetical protein BIFGAL_02664 [Bifidobacterium gallicum DSM 20093 = LMG 11596]|uniref:Uncharacterized protein n=1 Tax=Bifidobacterium gallicum DSM 20093 = LMG 11596 TaxID=561180 RepID=D1NSA8_9BIFI|nr:hypothetical protein BIFGAL_02664 [Bifidobacterium gallicum DSM 20093 = LMG 11596]